MRPRLVVLVLLVAALAAVPIARADGPPEAVVQGDPGVTGGAVRYRAMDSAGDTVVQALRASDGTFLRWRRLRGRWGMPQITYGVMDGLSADRRTLVLGEIDTYGAPKRWSRFVFFDPVRFRARETIRLRGDFYFDALSPTGRVLYLIQHVSPTRTDRYVVRAYDRRLHRLRPGRIADRTQRSWVMQGMPMTRTTSRDGRWVYTLYTNPGGYPFVHALDTVRGVAHCVGIPWPADKDQAAFYNVRLVLRNGGRTLALRWRSGRAYLDVDTRSWRVSAPTGGFAWWLLAVTTGGVAALALVGGRRRWRRQAVALGGRALRATTPAWLQ